MSEILDKSIVLALNANWQPIGVRTVREAIVQLCSTADGLRPAAMALDIHYKLNDDGSPNHGEVIGMNPVPWDAWVTLPLRSWDMTLNTTRSKIRVPTVIVASQYRDMPKKKAHVSKNGIRQRDNDTCQVTNRKLKKGEGNIDHIIPRSRGGRDSWENLVYMDKALNSKKGDKTLHEMGWKLIRNPVVPKDLPISATIREARHPDWEHFIIK